MAAPVHNLLDSRRLCLSYTTYPATAQLFTCSWQGCLLRHPRQLPKSPSLYELPGMRNVRLDSLPKNRSIASRGMQLASSGDLEFLTYSHLDCALCTRRRIRCDRTTPSCIKCASRNLACPGFRSINLRWNQGVASRGKFAGSKLPVQRGQAPTTTASMRRSRARGSHDHASQTLQSRTETADPLLQATEDLSERMSGALLCTSQTISLVNRCRRVVLLNKLLDHFSVEVIPRMTWIEVPGNLWSNALRTFAQSSDCLSLSLTCLAAAHLSATRSDPKIEYSPFHQMHIQLREFSLRYVNNRITSILTNTPGEMNEETIRTWLTEVLASMVALRYSEAFVPTPTRWQLHLRGCQTVVDQLSSYHKRKPERSVEMFLIKEVADFEALDALSSLSTTSPPATKSYSVPTCSDSFWGFLGLIREITCAERIRQRSQHDQHVPAMDMTVWHVRAHESYLAIVSNISNMFSSQEKMRCFEQVVRTHYYAIVIYAYHALAPESVSETAVMADDLFAILKDISITDDTAMKGFLHDLFFPLLIAGAQCSTDKGLQSMIERLFLKALYTSGVWCNNTSLQFLQSYWQRPEVDFDMTWIQYARSERIQARSFIVF